MIDEPIATVLAYFAKVVALHDAGRVVFQQQTMRVVTASGNVIVMSPEDILSFRGDEPYAVIHLH